MDSDFRRPKRSSKEPLDSHVPRPQSYETKSPQASNATQGQLPSDSFVFHDVKTASNPGASEQLPKVGGSDSAVPNAAPTTPKVNPRPQTMKKRLPQMMSRGGGSAGSQAPVSDTQSVDDTARQVGMNPTDRSAKKKRGGSAWKWIVGVLITLMVIAAVAAFVIYTWYNNNIAAVDPSSDEVVRITVPEGTYASEVGPILDEAGLLRNQNAFKVYYRLNGGDDIKAGVYVFTKNQSVPEIVSKLESGENDDFALTFLPGGTIFHAKKVMMDAGYGEEEVDAALYADYDSPILKDRPAGSSIEGYIYGETYSFLTGSSAQEVFGRTIKHLEDYIVANDIEAKFAQRGFNIHEGLTFASLVQTEVAQPDEMKQVSSVFHNRLDIDMMLGSDVTFRYAAKLLDEPVTIEIDSPYNTRIYKGLPPGPVAAPGASAIEATVEPDNTEYLFFVSGDDEVTYFSRTNEEHERLTREHCDANCQVQM